MNGTNGCWHSASDRTRPAPLVAHYGCLRALLAGAHELDFGVWWWAGEPYVRPAWRVSLAIDAGALYCVQSPEHDDSRAEVIAYDVSRSEVERALEGWGDRCGRANSLGWVFAVAARLGSGARA